MTDKDKKDIPDFITPMQEGLISLHVMYEQLKEAGFKRKEALYLVAQILIQATGAGSDE